MVIRKLIKDYSPVNGVIVTPQGEVHAFAKDLAKWENEGLLKKGKIAKDFSCSPHKTFHANGTVTLSEKHAAALTQLGYLAEEEIKETASSNSSPDLEEAKEGQRGKKVKNSK